MTVSVHDLTAQAVIHAACERSGLTDFGGDDFREPLEHYIAGLQDNADAYSAGGARQIFAELVRALESRLAITDYIRRNPAVAHERISRPVFITGLYRSATTKLQNLLCADTRWLHVQTWQAGDPVPLPGVSADGEDPRIEICRGRLAYMAQAARQAFLAHPLAATDPSEEYSLMTPSFRIVDAKQFSPAYFDWIETQSKVPVYRDLHRALQVLQHQFKRRDIDEQRFCLKAPIHLGNLDALLEVFPDAKILVTHRDPFPAIHSYSMVRESLRGMYMEKVDARVLGAEILERSARALDSFLEVRSAKPDHFLDLAFPDVVSRASELIESIYAFVQSPVTADAKRALLTEDARREEHRSGADRRDPGHYGLSPAAVHRRTRAYMNWAARNVGDIS